MNVQWTSVDSFKSNSGSPSLMEHRQCPVCGSIRAKQILVYDDFLFLSDSGTVPKMVDIRHCQCRDCLALYMNPCYSEKGFKILFEEAGMSYVSPNRSSREEERIAWLNERQLLKKGKSIIDIGCFEGSFLGRLPGYIKKFGIDIDRFAIERGRKKYLTKGVELFCGDFDTFKVKARPDIITMFHVLEHLPRPLTVLRNLRAIARESSQLIVEVPLLENGITDDINGFFSVQHLTHFSKNSLGNCFLETGWKVVEWNEQQDYNGCRVRAFPVRRPVGVIEGKEDPGLLLKYLSAHFRSLYAVEQKIARYDISPYCVIWGGGLHTEILYQTTSFFKDSGRKYIIVDSDTLKHGKTWRGIPIVPATILSNVDWSTASLVISSYGSQEVIKKAALDLRVPFKRIITFYKEPKSY